MKKNRHALILDIIEDNCVSTQEELLNILKSKGVNATQATVSRDIKELHLVKKTNSSGNYCYTYGKNENDEFMTKFTTIFIESVISAEAAGHIVAIKCFTGMANAVCAKLDAMNWDNIVGTIAGDDTIFALCRDDAKAIEIQSAIHALLNKS